MDRPLQACAEPGCPARVARGRCSVHAVPAPASAFTLRQGSRQARGYGADWERLRDWFLRQPENVLCRSCEAAGRVTLAQEVDHVVAFERPDDPKRLDPSNLQALCRRCHRKKTGRYPKHRGDV